jgi:hypothetical protein
MRQDDEDANIHDPLCMHDNIFLGDATSLDKGYPW